MAAATKAAVSFMVMRGGEEEGRVQVQVRDFVKRTCLSDERIERGDAGASDRRRVMGESS